MTTPDTVALVDRLTRRFDGDHDRGCDGRNYACSCGYSDGMDALCDEAAAVIQAQAARIAELEGR